MDDPEIDFVETDPEGFAWEGTLEPPVMIEEWVPFVPGEEPWERVGADAPELVAGAAEPQALPEPQRRKG